MSNERDAAFNFRAATLRDAKAKLVEIRDVRDFEFLTPDEADVLIQALDAAATPGRWDEFLNLIGADNGR